MVQQFRAVFFDVGGTLLHVHPSVGEVYALHARSFGFKGDASELNKRFAEEWKSMGGMESLGRQKGPDIEQQFWHDLVYRVFQPLGGLENFDKYFEQVYQAFSGKDSWRVFEDVEKSQILKRLKKNGVILGVISNWDSRLPLILENLGLASYFDFILASTVVGSAKPDSLIFKEALRQSGVAKEEACHIGDEPKADFLGARNAGLHSILIDRKGIHENLSPKIQSFEDLI